MNDKINYKNNPLNGVGLKTLVTELANYYGFELLFAYLNINCFKTNPSIHSSVKFLKKTDWAREKVEAFYLYQFKNLPQPPASQLSQSPRDRIIPDDQKPGAPAELTLENAAHLRQQRESKAAEWEQHRGQRRGSSKHFNQPRGKHANNRGQHRPRSNHHESSSPLSNDPWAKARGKTE